MGVGLQLGYVKALQLLIRRAMLLIQLFVIEDGCLERLSSVYDTDMS